MFDLFVGILTFLGRHDADAFQTSDVVVKLIGGVESVPPLGCSIVLFHGCNLRTGTRDEVVMGTSLIPQRLSDANARGSPDRTQTRQRGDDKDEEQHEDKSRNAEGERNVE